MKVVCDAHIPFFVEAVLEGWQDVEICPMEPEQIDASVVRDVDVLVVRTRTRVNEALLSGSRVRMVCTATIGFDHIDTAYCDAHRIRWMSCPGCNARAVCDYIEEAIGDVQRDKVLCSKELTIGVVGVGHVGSLVAKMAERKGYKVLLNDPPKGIGVSFDESEGIGFFSDGEIADCDIITFHVPLVKSPMSYPTWHLCDEVFLSKCRSHAVIINAARGGVVDEQALLRSGHPYILDTWENEPDINPQVLQYAFRASMHIAGYSLEGKRNASQMCLDAISDAFGMPRIDIRKLSVESGHPSVVRQGWLSAVTEALKAQPDSFESLRKAYPLR